jgi:hypothetical protein
MTSLPLERAGWRRGQQRRDQLLGGAGRRRDFAQTRAHPAIVTARAATAPGSRRRICHAGCAIGRRSAAVHASSSDSNPPALVRSRLPVRMSGSPKRCDAKCSLDRPAPTAGVRSISVTYSRLRSAERAVPLATPKDSAIRASESSALPGRYSPRSISVAHFADDAVVSVGLSGHLISVRRTS